MRFPDRRIFLTGEIIHNPHVNDQLRSQGIRFLSDPGESLDALDADDVVILPAFGVTVELLEALVARGCTLVDTTCGSVLNVWKNVKRYADEGFTSVIHGKYWHEETRATASQARAGRAAATIWSCSTAPRPASPATTSATAATARRSSQRFAHAVVAGLRPGHRTCSASAAPTRRRC